MPTDQAQPLSKASLSRQQAFATSTPRRPCVNSRCFLVAVLLRKVDTRQESWRALPEGLNNLLRVWLPMNLALLGSLEPDYWVTPAFLPHTPAFPRALQLAAQAFSGSKCACSSADTGWPHRHLHYAQHSLSGF